MRGISLTLSEDQATLHLIADEIGISAPSQMWKSLDDFLPFLEKMRQEEAVVLIKFDGERKSNPYTAAVTGAVMGEDFFRTDSRSLTDALTRVVIHYARVKWKISL